MRTSTSPLSAVLDPVCSEYGKREFLYETNIRNDGSMRLLKKPEEKFEILERDFEKAVARQA